MNQQYLKNVVTLQFYPLQCMGCGKCLEVCPHGVFATESGNGRRVEMKNRDACMECGACAKNCAAGAITVTAGVGCAWAITRSMFTGKEPTCGCDTSSGGSSACCG